MGLRKSKNFMLNISRMNKSFILVLCLIGIIHFVVLFSYASSSKSTKVVNYSQISTDKTSIKIELNTFTNTSKKQISKSGNKKKKSVKQSMQKKHISKKKILKNKGTKSEIAKYLSYVRKVVDNAKEYPRMAKRLKQQGKVKIELVLNQVGSILSYKILEESTYSSLNKASLDIFKNIEKFLPLPKSIKESEYKIIIPINYELI